MRDIFVNKEKLWRKYHSEPLARGPDPDFIQSVGILYQCKLFVPIIRRISRLLVSAVRPYWVVGLESGFRWNTTNIVTYFARVCSRPCPKWLCYLKYIPKIEKIKKNWYPFFFWIDNICICDIIYFWVLFLLVESWCSKRGHCTIFSWKQLYFSYF